jgi:hypothetical protein
VKPAMVGRITGISTLLILRISRGSIVTASGNVKEGRGVRA